MVIIRNREFRVVSQSRNLRGLLTYARTHQVIRVDLYEHGAQLGVAYADGATCITDFADYSVLCQWVETRRKFSRGWADCMVVKHVHGVAA